MMMTQEQAFLKAFEQFQALRSYVEEAADQGERIDQVERELFSQLLLVGRTVMEGFINRQGTGDAGETIEQEGQTLRRCESLHARRYLSIFGELTIWRCCYATREGQKMTAPLDARLGLPGDDFSYVLEDWLQRFCVKESFHEATASLRDLLGVAPSERAAEQMNQRMARNAARLHLRRNTPPPDEEGELLVATADGKGVPMRRPLEERVRRGPRRGKGEKANKKKMAYVGAVYSIDRYRRTADDVVNEILRRQRQQNRPVPQHKRVWAELTGVAEGEPCSGREYLFVEMAVACAERDPQQRKTWVCLLDGEAGLWSMRDKWLGNSVGILDLFHVLERLWNVAHCLHAEHSTRAAEFVNHHLRMLLEGKVGYVIGNFRRLLNQGQVCGSSRKTIRAVITYYENNRDHMRYDEYLAAGYPIGSGVAEGACRHLVKDRLELTGMRWTPEGAQAMLHTRAVYLNGQWNELIEYHIQTEQAALYHQIAA